MEEPERWLIDSLMMKIERSLISDRLEDFIRLNLHTFSKEQVENLIKKVDEATPENDPKKQFVNWFKKL